MPVDQQRVGVGRYLRRDPGSQPHERGGQSLAPWRRSERSVANRMLPSAVLTGDLYEGT